MNNHEIDLVINKLKSAGNKVTEPRKMIIEYMINHQTHPTVDMIHSDLNNLPLSTIYNTLELLVDMNIVIEIDSTNDEKTHYDYFGKPHYHVVCTNCGKITDADNFDFSKLPTAANEATDYHITGMGVEVYGLCPDCQKITNKKE
ncbi:transcriptional repressor [Companilactobacillus sp. RD055328]|uniref:Fur family transcriptional regulator n=1 Tax=Companilactobacillus sp. RD055328 TaxID=2916634 RepID=UPI001FC81AD5|nr:Fur family transcriptional regulator [Companilactobacillus sp. RD055328]GKQ42705.1 transcriptional repressor [Companilactobacillus sp. RD055328]